jgi:hypothetical protein
MGGFVLRPDPSKPDIIVPTRNKLIELFESGELDVPDFDDSDIEDRNKANWFTKSLTIIQTGYFIVQLIGRWEQSLPTTTLELFTLSIVFFAVLTYTAWWTKPFDIQKPIVLPLRPHYDDRVGAIESIKRAQLLDGGSDGTQDNLKDWIGLICVTPTFAAIHLIGWNFSFPTQREQMIWRVGSILSGAVPFVWATIGAYFVHTKSDKRHEFRSNLIHLSFMVVYLAIRIVLGVEMLVNLRSVPAGVYETPEWTEYFPWFS